MFGKLKAELEEQMKEETRLNALIIENFAEGENQWLKMQS